MVEYEVPEKLKIFMDKFQAAEKLRDIYVKLPFGFGKAKRCAADVAYFRRKF